jgi:hypothetical protein
MIEASEVARRLLVALHEREATMPLWDDLSPKQQSNWTTAVRESSAGGPFLTQLNPPMDFNESTFELARGMLGGIPVTACTIVHSSAIARGVRDLKKKLLFAAVEVPEPLMKSLLGWAVVSEAGTVWSNPTW